VHTREKPVCGKGYVPVVNTGDLAPPPEAARPRREAARIAALEVHGVVSDPIEDR